MTRTIVTLRGRVQAVGFRDTVLRIAACYAVAGTVRNLRDGERLEIDVEGDGELVAAFIGEVVANPPHGAHITGIERRSAAPQGRHAFAVAATL